MTDQPTRNSTTPAARRRVRVFRLGEEPGDDLSASTTAEERVAMVRELSRRLWSLTGRPFPDVPRHELPVRVIRPA